MARTHLPHDAKAGPTKAEVRSVLLAKLRLESTSHFAEVGSCTGAVTIEAARRAGRITALERNESRARVTAKNLVANDVPIGRSDSDIAVDTAVETVPDGGTATTDTEPAPVTIRVDEAPAGLPETADALFLGGSRNYEAVLDRAIEMSVDRLVMNVSRLEVAGGATEAFRERDLLEEVIQLQVSHGYELAGATSFDAENPVYMLVGSASTDGAEEGGE